MLQTTEDVHISNCTFADSLYACIGIGSETSGGIRDVWIKNCKFTAAKTQAIYIKSRPGRGAFIENIFADGLEVSNCAGGFLRLNMANSGIQDQDPVPGIDGIPTASNWRFSNVVVHDVPKLVQATELDPRKPLDELWLTQHYRHLQGGNFPGTRAACRSPGHPGDGLQRSAAECHRRDRQGIGGRQAVPGAGGSGRCSDIPDAL